MRRVTTPGRGPAMLPAGIVEALDSMRADAEALLEKCR